MSIMDGGLKVIKVEVISIWDGSVLTQSNLWIDIFLTSPSVESFLISNVFLLVSQVSILLRL